MSPAERPLGSATIDHVALSVGDLDTMAGFYAKLGFDEISRSDFAPAPVRSAIMRNPAGATLELTAHGDSAQVPPAGNAIAAAKRRGIFHYALRVTRLEQSVADATAAGAMPLSAPATNSRGDARFAYLADPEGNLIELVSPIPPDQRHPPARGIDHPSSGASAMSDAFPTARP
jgi:catechol 2,3-dioxygenase-like lactoylglutathione lyase family enzyme